MLLTDDLRRFVGWTDWIGILHIDPFSSSDQCQKVLDKAFDSWNNQDYNRRLYQIQLMDDVPDNYEPKKQARSVAPKTVSAIETTVAHGKAKKWKTRAISCK